MNIFPTLEDATTLLHHHHRLHLFNTSTTSYTKPQNNLGSDTTPAHMFIVSRLAFPCSRIVCTINCCSFSSHVCLSHLISLPSHCTIQAVSSGSFAHTSCNPWHLWLTDRNHVIAPSHSVHTSTSLHAILHVPSDSSPTHPAECAPPLCFFDRLMIPPQSSYLV